MKCENCNKNEAVYFYEETVNGHTRSVRLCGDCAAHFQAGNALFDNHIIQHPFSPLSQSGSNILDGLFGISASAAAPKPKSVCPGCNATWSELLKAGKAFCPQCYTAFGDELKPTLRSLHGNVTHIGRAPAGQRAQRERRDRLSTLRAELVKAIAEERFEDAAGLRDEIRTLEQQ